MLSYVYRTEVLLLIATEGFFLLEYFCVFKFTYLRFSI